MTATAPTYSITDGTTNILSAFLVNAVEAGSDPNFLCDQSHYPNSYWAQAGFTYTTSVKQLSWSDTVAQCVVQGSTGLKYTDGDNYEFKVVVLGTDWHIIGKDTTTNQPAFDIKRTGIPFLSFDVPNTNTSVWSENQNTGTSWYQKYASPYTISATASLTTDYGSTWSNWESAGKTDVTCGGSSQTDSTISGSVASGSTGTWNMQTFSSLHC
jgi:hypothetical protein